jgi:hypothetical protein
MKTVLLLDSIESVIVLNKEHSQNILNLSSHCSNGVDRNYYHNISLKSEKKRKSLNQEVKQSLTEGLLQYVVLSAGEKGVIFFHSISLMGKDISTFQCYNLYQISLSNAAPEMIVPLESKLLNLIQDNQYINKLIASNRKLNETGKNDVTRSKHKNMDNILENPTIILPESIPISHMLYLPITQEIVVVSADHNIYSMDM